MFLGRSFFFFSFLFLFSFIADNIFAFAFNMKKKTIVRSSHTAYQFAFFFLCLSSQFACYFFKFGSYFFSRVFIRVHVKFMGGRERKKSQSDAFITECISTALVTTSVDESYPVTSWNCFLNKKKTDASLELEIAPTTWMFLNHRHFRLKLIWHHIRHWCGLGRWTKNSFNPFGFFYVKLFLFRIQWTFVYNPKTTIFHSSI